MRIIRLLITSISFLSMTNAIDLQAGGKHEDCGHALHFHHCLPLRNSACTASPVMEQLLARAKITSLRSKSQTLFQCWDVTYNNL